jgi:hypothetical protein
MNKLEEALVALHNEEQAAIDFHILDERQIDLSVTPEKPVAVFRLAGVPISTAGNLTNVNAQAKSGKSATIGAMLAAIEAASLKSCFGFDSQYDCLGFEASDHNGKAVILFDTEQSRYDSWRNLQRAAKRVKLKKFSSNFRAYGLCDLSANERRKYLSAEMERAFHQCGGIHAVFIDGIADLCNDPNDPDEAFGLVAELVQLAIKYSCPIILVLHENPGNGNGGWAKTRGHLGSQLERKAETNLRITVNDGISTLQLERCRNAGLPKHLSPRFRWSDIDEMHASIPPDDGSEALAKKRIEQADTVKCVFHGQAAWMNNAALRKRIMDVEGCSTATANRRIADWTISNLLTKADDGRYSMP